MKQFTDLLTKILRDGKHRKDRTGTGTIGIFGYDMRFDMKKGFPLLTTKKMHLKSIIHELLWFLKGSTNIKYLNDNGVTIWNGWADKHGELGPIYGHQWRKWRRFIYDHKNIDEALNANGMAQNVLCDIQNIDQIADAIRTLQTNPDSRRIMVSAWNVGEIDDMKLPPCHYGFQISTFEMTFLERFYYALTEKERVKMGGLTNYTEYSESVTLFEDAAMNLLGRVPPSRWISLKWEQRSVDVFLGLPFNIASYGLLLMMIAQVVNMMPDELICSLGDTHLYLNHIEQANLQLQREPRDLPEMHLNSSIKSIYDFKYEDFQLVKYNPHPHIKGDISL